MNRYQDIKKIKNTNPNVGTLGAQYLKPVFYPEIKPNQDDIYVITEFGDRFDLLAYQFYDDVSLYWVISTANPDKITMGSLTIKEGTQLKIPSGLNNIIEQYNKLNN